MPKVEIYCIGENKVAGTIEVNDGEITKLTAALFASLFRPVNSDYTLRPGGVKDGEIALCPRGDGYLGIKAGMVKTSQPKPNKGQVGRITREEARDRIISQVFHDEHVVSRIDDSHGLTEITLGRTQITIPI